MSLHKLIFSIVFVGLFSLMCTSHTSAQSTFSVQPAISGNWFNPSESGHGLIIEILPDNRVGICWFAFDLDGNHAWICGSGSHSGNTITMDAFTVEGGAFPPLFDPDNVSVSPWGTFTLTFSDCNHALFEWTTDRDGFESGNTDLQRLTLLAGLVCTEETSVISATRSESGITQDGIISANEWSGAGEAVLEIRPDWLVPVLFKHDGTQLYIAFTGISGPLDENRVNAAQIDTVFPELFFHVDPDNATELLDDQSHWYHMSFQDCYDQGRIRSVRLCAFELGGWKANNWPLASSVDAMEVSISLEMLGVAPGDTVRVMATMTSSLVGAFVYHNWPSEANERMPDSWPLMTIEP